MQMLEYLLQYKLCTHLRVNGWLFVNGDDMSDLQTYVALRYTEDAIYSLNCEGDEYLLDYSLLYSSRGGLCLPNYVGKGDPVKYQTIPRFQHLETGHCRRNIKPVLQSKPNLERHGFFRWLL
jgi:hypothetical protein